MLFSLMGGVVRFIIGSVPIVKMRQFYLVMFMIDLMMYRILNIVLSVVRF